MGILSNKISKESLKPGDHIYSWRHGYVYSHHGIYAGENGVIHFARRGDRYIPNAEGARVVKSSLESFLREGDLYLFLYSVSPAFFVAKARGGTCTLATSDPAEDVLHRATCLLGNGGMGFGPYSLFKNNCEDFAVYCNTGLVVSVGRSGQVTALFAVVVTAAVSSLLRYLLTPRSCFGVFIVLACSVYCLTRLVSDISLRPAVVKLPVQRLVVEDTADSRLNQPPEMQLIIHQAE